MKIFVLLTVFSFSSLFASGQKFFSCSLNPVCDSLTGFFYLYTGYTIDSKFYKKDIRDIDGYGFFYEKGNIFNGDTLYMPVEKRDEDFINILDSMKAVYTLHSDSYWLMDSLMPKYNKSKSIKIEWEPDKGDMKCAKDIFIKLKMKIFYNQSYIKQQVLDGRLCFTEKGLLTSCKSQDFYFKAILKFEVLE